MDTRQSSPIMLRKFREEDLQSYYECTNNPIIKPYFDMIYSPDLDYAKKRLDMYIHNAQNEMALAVVLKEDPDAIIGGILLTEPYKQNYRKRVYFDVFINPLHWNKGYITEAIKLSLPLVKKRFGNCTLCAYINNPKNIGAFKAAEKCGFKRETPHINTSNQSVYELDLASIKFEEKEDECER